MATVVAGYTVPLIGPLVTTAISIIYHVRAKIYSELNGKQLAEWPMIDIIQGVIFGLISITVPPGINFVVACIVALSLGTLLAYLGSKQQELKNGVTIGSLLVSLVRSTKGEPEVDPVFCCPITGSVMKKPAMLNGTNTRKSANG